MGRIPCRMCVRSFVMTGYAIAPLNLGQRNSSNWPLNLPNREADRRGEVGTGQSGAVGSPTRPAHREAHLFQVSMHLVALIALDFHLAFLQGTTGSAMRFQLLDQVDEVVRMGW